MVDVVVLVFILCRSGVQRWQSWQPCEDIQSVLVHDETAKTGQEFGTDQ